MNPTADRVRAHTAREVLRRIDDTTTAHLRRCADDSPQATTERPALLALPALVAASVLLHARTGRYPLMPLFRRLGLRTAREIARERYALKVLRSDFASMDSESTPGLQSAARGNGQAERAGQEPI